MVFAKQVIGISTSRKYVYICCKQTCYRINEAWDFIAESGFVDFE